jgi:hypothetical protein
METNKRDLSDFRGRAVAASVTMKRGLSTGVLIEKSGNSYCLHRRPDFSRFRTRIKIVAVTAAIIGIGGLLAGGLIVKLLDAQNHPRLLALALCCSVGGVATMFFPTFFERRIVRQHLSTQAGNLGSGSALDGFHVSLEYAPTYGAPKILAEDVGLLYLHPEAHYIRIDGLSYEYVIQGKDVVSLVLHRNRKSVLLAYKIGQEQLEIAIVPRSVRAELKRQTMGSSRTLFAGIQFALDTPAPLPK